MRPNEPQDLPDGVFHGTKTAYDRYRCGCRHCKRANARYMSAYRIRRKKAAATKN